MRGKNPVGWAILIFLGAGPAFPGAPKEADKTALTTKLWPQSRILEATKAVEEQRRNRLLSDESYQKKMAMLKARAAGAYVSQSLAVTDPPLNFVQNAGFEKVNRNSEKNRSRWLWWGGWSCSFGRNYPRSRRQAT